MHAGVRKRRGMLGKNYKWYALAMLWVISFLNYLDRNVIYSVFPLIQKNFNLTKTELGMLSSGFLIVYAVSVPLLGNRPTGGIWHGLRKSFNPVWERQKKSDS